MYANAQKQPNNTQTMTAGASHPSRKAFGSIKPQRLLRVLIKVRRVLEILVMLLVVLWALSMPSYTSGEVIYALLVIAVMMILIGITRVRKV